MVRREGRKVSWHLADITKSPDVNRMIDEFVEEHGRIDILVNNAMVITMTHFLAITEEEWDSQVNVDLKGYFLCSQRAAQQMVEQGQGGRIVSIASVHAYHAWPNDLVYAVCKAGVVRMAQTMALDLAGHDINSNCVAPGYTDSRLLPPDQEHLRAGPGYGDEAKKLIPARAHRGPPRHRPGGPVPMLSSERLRQRGVHQGGRRTAGGRLAPDGVAGKRRGRYIWVASMSRSSSSRTTVL